MTVDDSGDHRWEQERRRLRAARADAEEAWSQLSAEAEKLESGPYAAAAKAKRAEEEAWERYMDICGDLLECTHMGCFNHSPDNVLCDEHRPK